MLNTTNKALHQLDQKHYLPTFRRYPVALRSGEGSVVEDVEGNKYIDMLAGIAVNSIGHCHPNLVKAISEQAGRLIHISNFYVSEPQVQLASKLSAMSGLQRVFFTNSGAESVEGAIKIARKYAHSKGRGGDIISFDGAFHGRTLATLAATGKKEMQSGFEPIPHGFKQAIFNDLESARKLVGRETAAFIVEPVQGEGGIRMAQKEFLKGLRELCDQEDIVLIFDEIQSGIGRTGHWLACDHFDVRPDVITLAKAMGGGVPIGAILSDEKVSAAIDYGDHGTTFGGNPLACAASLATLAVIEEEKLLEAAGDKGEWIRKRVMELDNDCVVEVRGMGLMIGIVFTFEAKILVEEMLRDGVLCNATAGNVLRLVPPLNISYEHLDVAMRALQRSIERIRRNA